MKVIVSALILASAGVLADSFQDSCEDLGIFSYVPDGEIRVGKNDFFIEGKCGLDKKTSLVFLDMCVANQDGKLVWRNRLVPLSLVAAVLFAVVAVSQLTRVPLAHAAAP